METPPNAPPAGRSAITPARLFVHLGLLVVTAVTTTIMGTILSVDVVPPEEAGLAEVIAALVGAIAGLATFLLVAVELGAD